MANENPCELKKVVIKEELVALTGDWRSALVLNQLLYWSKRTKDADKFLEEERSRDPDMNVELTHGWIYKAASELAEELMIGVAETSILRYMSILVEKGWVDRRRNPRHKWDRTWQYRPNILKIQTDLQALGYALADYPLMTHASLKSEDRSKLLRDRNPDNTPALPEITPEITSQTTTNIREEAPDGAVSDADASWPVGDPPITEPTPTTPPQESILKQKDPILMAAEVARRTGGKASWTVAGPEGADLYLDGPLDATLRILRREREGLDPEARAKLARQLRRIVEGPAYEKETDPPANGTPALFLQACRLWPDEFAWKAKSRIAYSNIYKGAFVDDMRSLMCQIQDGTIGASSKLVITNA